MDIIYRLFGCIMVWLMSCELSLWLILIRYLVGVLVCLLQRYEAERQTIWIFMMANSFRWIRKCGGCFDVISFEIYAEETFIIWAHSGEFFKQIFFNEFHNSFEMIWAHKILLRVTVTLWHGQNYFLNLSIRSHPNEWNQIHFRHFG